MSRSPIGFGPGWPEGEWAQAARDMHGSGFLKRKAACLAGSCAMYIAECYETKHPELRFDQDSGKVSAKFETNPISRPARSPRNLRNWQYRCPLRRYRCACLIKNYQVGDSKRSPNRDKSPQSIECHREMSLRGVVTRSPSLRTLSGQRSVVFFSRRPTPATASGPPGRKNGGCSHARAFCFKLRQSEARDWTSSVPL